MATMGHSLLPVIVQGKTSETDLKNVNTRRLHRNSRAWGIRASGPTVWLHRQACKPHWIYLTQSSYIKEMFLYSLLFSVVCLFWKCCDSWGLLSLKVGHRFCITTDRHAWCLSIIKLILLWHKPLCFDTKVARRLNSALLTEKKCSQDLKFVRSKKQRKKVHFMKNLEILKKLDFNILKV
jgi:hypothetical protein